MVRLFKFLCKKKGHDYRFVEAWCAHPVSIMTNKGVAEEILLTYQHHDPIKDYKHFLGVLDYYSFHDPRYRQRFLITLKCKRCGHRITVDDTYFMPN